MKKNFKLLICGIISNVFALSLVACNSNKTDDISSNSSENSSIIDNNPEVANGETTGYFYKDVCENVTFEMFTKTGSFSSVKKGDITLTRRTSNNQNGEFGYNVGTKILTFYSDYLATLDEGNHVFKFSTDLGSVDLTIMVFAEGAISGYNFMFADPGMTEVQNPECERIYAKVMRSDTAATFEFITFGNFDKEDNELEFINVLIDNPYYNTDRTNWRLSEGDFNFRIYSDGWSIYRNDYTGKEITPGKPNPGQDNIWWRANTEEPNYIEFKKKATITKEYGLTKISLSIDYALMGIEANSDFRITFMEASAASAIDFNMYQKGYVYYNGTFVGEPSLCSNWVMIKADGSIVLPNDIEVKGPEGYNLTFGTNNGDNIVAKVSATNGEAVTFDFWTSGTFSTSGNALEFVQIYIDMPEYNKYNGNWRFRDEDRIVRIYSDGSAYLLSGFNDTSDNIWVKRNEDTFSKSNFIPMVTKLNTVDINTKKGATVFSIRLTAENLGVGSISEFHFYLAEASDNSMVDFEYYGSDFKCNDEALGDGANCENFAVFKVSDNIVTLPTEESPEGYNLTFGTNNGDNIFAKVSATNGEAVTFDFWTSGTFSTSGNALEFVQIYIDMPEYNKYNGNWRFRDEDRIVRIYSDGSAYLLSGFNDTSDNIWVKRNEDTFSKSNFIPMVTKLNTVDINTKKGATVFSIRLTAENLGVGSISEFHFYLAEASDNSMVDFEYYGSDFKCNDEALGDGANCENFAVFKVSDNIVTLPDRE